MVTARAVHEVLNDLDYPATKEQVVEHAERRSADDEVLRALRALPLGDYESREDITKGLAPADQAGA
jgi:hypothetical protein